MGYSGWENFTPGEKKKNPDSAARDWAQKNFYKIFLRRKQRKTEGEGNRRKLYVRGVFFRLTVFHTGKRQGLRG